MKALYEINNEPGKIEGPAVGVLSQLDELSHDASFVAHKLFLAKPEMAALAEFDEHSSLLDSFTICLDDSLKPTFNARMGAVMNTTFRPVMEDKMKTNMSRGFAMETDESATGRFGFDDGELSNEALEPPSLFGDADDDVSYEGAAGIHNSSGPLDLPTMNWGDDPLKHNAKTSPAQRSGDGEEALDLPELW